MVSAVHTSLACIICLSLGVSWASLPLEDEPAEEVSLLQRGTEFRNKRASAPARAKTQGIPSFYVDLDAAPEDRWQNVTSHWLELGMYPQALRQIGPLSSFAKELFKVMEVDEEYLREMRGIVAQINDPEVSVDSLILESVGYELSGSVDDPSFLPQKSSIGCSGLLAAMPNGTVVHGRNMDYGGFEYVGKDGRVYHYPDVTVEVVFVKAGKPFITSTHWPGMTGIHTAMRYGGWSFEQNTRFHGARTSLLYGLVQGSGGFMLRARKVMEQVADFETAVQQLAASNVMAPQYFIMAGPEPYQGAVITMDRGGEHLNGTPPVRRVSSGPPVVKDGQSYEGWYVFQTNDDMGGMPVDLRTPTEQVRLRRSRQEMVSTDWVYDQLTTPPVFNDGTVFTTMYVPATGYHSTTVWPEHAR
mmetsp:Transcript_73726/g.203510  ORF Transcript_73726/g.203510 Transcript_73726/m.203510 type:complete len:415 (+) Transcript_73726:103-1347(+)